MTVRAVAVADLDFVTGRASFFRLRFDRLADAEPAEAEGGGQGQAAVKQRTACGRTREVFPHIVLQKSSDPDRHGSAIEKGEQYRAEPGGCKGDPPGASRQVEEQGEQQLPRLGAESHDGYVAEQFSLARVEPYQQPAYQGMKEEGGAEQAPARAFPVVIPRRVGQARATGMRVDGARANGPSRLERE